MIKRINSLLIASIVCILLLPSFVFAVESNPALDRLKNVGPASGYNATTDTTTFSSILGIVVSAFLALLGIIFVAMILQGGYNWMYAGGNEDRLDKAKNQIRRAIIGLIITISAYAIYNYVWFQFLVK